MEPKSIIYTLKRDDEHLRPFHMGVPPSKRQSLTTVISGLHSNDHTGRTTDSPGFKTFTVYFFYVIYQTLETVFHRDIQTKSIFDEIRGVCIADETLSRVFEIYFQWKQKLMSKQTRRKMKYSATLGKFIVECSAKYITCKTIKCSVTPGEFIAECSTKYIKCKKNKMQCNPRRIHCRMFNKIY